MIPASRRSISPTFGYFALVALVIAAAASMSGESASLSVSLINALLLLIALVISTAVHEAAHASVGRALGLRPTYLFLGRGPLVWQTKIGETRIILQAVPLTGATLITAPSMRWLRMRLMAVFAAGPFANALLCLVAASQVPVTDPHHGVLTAPAPITSFVIVNGALAFLNALPVAPRTRRGIAHPGTDGWNFFALPFRSDEKLSPIVVAYEAHEAARLTRADKFIEARTFLEEALRRHPASTILRVCLTDVMVLTEDWSAGAAALRELIADPTIEQTLGATASLLSNNLAWADFMLDDAALSDEADRRSLIAITKLRDRAATQGTRGAVLLVRGELAEAEKLLLSSFAANTGSNQAFNACCLAMLYAKKGALDEARSWLDKARKMNTKCSLQSRAEAAIAHATV